MLNTFRDELTPGDVYIINDPYEGGMHLPNVVLLAPIFVGIDLLGHAVVLAHHTDIGGAVPGSVPVGSREVFAEGLRIPPMVLERHGARNRTLLTLLEKNVRLPRDVFGDLNAQITSCRLGEQRLQRLAAKYGLTAVQAAMTGVLNRSERMARAEIASLPDGDYTFEDYLDNDGLDGPRQVLRVTLRIRGDELTADFTGTAPQAPSAINSPLAYTQSALYLTVRSIMPPEVPNSAGFFRPLHLHAPEGTLVNPSFPAAVGAMGVTGYRLVDTVFGALAQAAPHRVRAASEGGSTRCSIDASQDGQRCILSESIVGAWGGHPAMDGVDGIANVAGNMANAPVEAVESAFPVLVEAYGFAPDSEGAGTFRGGLGIRRQFRLLAPDGVCCKFVRDVRRSIPGAYTAVRPAPRAKTS